MSISNYKVSVIIPIYNVKDYLKRAMDSLINQTIGFENIQVIMVDDCSNDGTKEIVYKYEQDFDNVQAIYLEKNSGSAAIPRNTGLKHVKADYVMFLDPDDEYCLDFCETLYEKIANNNVDLVKCNFINIDNDGRKVKSHYFDFDVDELVINRKGVPLRTVSVCNGIHKRELLRKKNIDFPNCIGEDVVFSLNEFLNIENMLYLNNYYGYVYRNMRDSHAKKPECKKICSILDGFELARDIAVSHNREDVAKTILGQQICGVYSRVMENQDSLKTKRRILNRVYEFEKTLPNLNVPDLLYKIANTLAKNKLFYLCLLYLSFLKFSRDNRILLKIYRVFNF